jgi:hypothetical protein
MCDIDASLVIDAQGNYADVLNLFPVNDFTLWLVVDAEGCGDERDLPCADEPLEPGEIPAAMLAATNSASVDDWAMVGCFDET